MARNQNQHLGASFPAPPIITLSLLSELDNGKCSNPRGKGKGRGGGIQGRVGNLEEKNADVTNDILNSKFNQNWNWKVFKSGGEGRRI